MSGESPGPAAMGGATPGAAAPGTSSPAFGEILQRLAERHDLTRSEAASALEQIVDGTTCDAETAAFLMALRVKGETADEIAGLLETMRRLAVPVDTPGRDTLVDVVGTGGDHLGTFNISTTAAFVVAGAGVKVAKHGNRAASSRCGSADVLESLGVRIDLAPAAVATCLERVGMGFMLASLHHPAMGKVAGVRKVLGVRTAFNLLGPLTNPAGVQRQLLGVSTAEHLDVLAGALARVGCRHALLVHGDEGMDELSVCARSTVVEVERGVVQPPYSLEPEEGGVARWAFAALLGGDPAENAAITRKVLGGSRGGPRDVVLLNAGAALYVAGAVTSIREGVERAAASIDTGRASKVLDDLVAVTNQLAAERA
jgi:anthranilate phosphoribosyltransferase